MYQKSILPNGIRVISESIPYLKSVTLGIWVATGSRHEQDHNHGVSHFIEHLMFKGTLRRTAKDIAEEVDAIGGQLNAFTAKEYTCFYMKVLDSHLDLSMDILSDMLHSSKFDCEDIKREREVVLEEVNMYEDSPDELVHDIHLSKIWPGHPLGRNILGTQEAIGHFNRDLVTEYYKSFYTPDNLIIAAAGHLTHEQLVALSNQYFGHLTGCRKQLPSVGPQLTASHSICEKDTEQAHLCLSLPGVPQKSPDIYPLHIINNILGGGISSRLFQSIREERGLAYSVYSYQTNYSDAGLFTVYAGTRPANAAQVTELIMQNIADIKKAGISAADLTKTKEQLKGSLMLGLESSSSRMSRIGKMETTLGKYISLDEVIANIEKVQLNDIYRVIDTLFVQENLSLTALGPLTQNSLPDTFTL